jgi:hypothetical protein
MTSVNFNICLIHHDILDSFLSQKPLNLKNHPDQLHCSLIPVHYLLLPDAFLLDLSAAKIDLNLEHQLYKHIFTAVTKSQLLFRVV